jgi:hypothetical protein
MTILDVRRVLSTNGNINKDHMTKKKHELTMLSS